MDKTEQNLSARRFSAGAFSNVIGNALRYGHRARVWLRRNGRNVEIVDDDGPGIPLSERQAVFAAFHRA